MKGNKKSVKRFLALLLSAAMIITYMPSGFITYAEETAPVATEEAKDSPAEETQTPNTVDESTTEAKSNDTPTADESNSSGSEDIVENTNGTDGEETGDNKGATKEETSGGSDAQGENANDGITNDEDKGDTTTYPETSFEPQKLGDVTISAEAPADALPEGTEMILEAASDDDIAAIKGSVNGDEPDVKAVKVIFTKDGETVTPKKALTYTVNAANTDDTRTYKVAYIDEDGKVVFEEVGYEFTAENLAVAGVVGVAAEAAKAPMIKAVGDENLTAAADVWTVNFRDRDGKVFETKTFEKSEEGSVIGNLPDTIAREDHIAYWAIGTHQEGEQGGTWIAGDRITASYVVKSDLDIIPDYDKITHSFNFFTDSSKTESVATKTVDYETSYCLNAIPDVPKKAGYVGKWVYSGGDFDNKVAAKDGNIDVWAEYEKNVFTVTYFANGKTYETDTYYAGDELTLPSEPTAEGKEFVKWVDDKGNEYSNGAQVTSDLELTAVFSDEYYVSFVVLGEDGETVVERLAQYFRTTGVEIGTMPQDPFAAGKVFEKWVNKETGEEVTAETIVNGNITAVAQFRTVDIYNITAEYYYINDSGAEVVFNTDLIQAEAHELPYTINAPATTKTSPDEVSGAPIYYPETPTVEIAKSDFDDNKEYTVRFKYVPYTATYDYVYLLKNLNGNGYTEIDRTRGVHGVLNSYVTPTVKQFDYANLELAEGATITQAEGQELNVYYTRKNFQVTYETNGGTYVGGATVPYGTEYSVTSTRPTRDGYTFAGWYTDAELTKPAGSSVTVEGDTTLYAKWTGDTVDYTIVYMFEKYNDAGTESSYVYDNSETGHGTVGSTIYANDSSIPDKTKKGWEKDNAKNAESKVVITADGSAVLLVYYKLKTYTFTFTINGDSTNGRYRMTIKGDTYRADRNTKYSFTAKLGQDISADWPINGNGGNATIWDNNDRYYFYYWSCQGVSYASKILRVTEELLPNNNTTDISVTGYWRNNDNNVQVNYYLQNADNDGYTLSTLYSQEAPSGSYSPKGIAGYTYHHSDNDTDWWGNVTAYNFYYNRHTYKIEYYNGTNKLKTISDVKYDATITGNTYNWTPTKEECDVEEDYTWGGWYDNAACEGTPYSFSKMPAGATNGSVALVLYAKWTPPSFNVKFVDVDGTTELADTQTIEKNHKVEKPSNPTKSGYTFDGWYTTADGDELFDWNTQITADTTVYAHWAQNQLSYTVHYVDGDGKAVADDKVVTNPNFVIGQTITEQAIAIAGYRPDVNSQTYELKGENNDITFVYTAKPETTSYTVRYILDPEEYPGDEIEVATEKSVVNVPGSTASVIELAAAVNYNSLYAAHPELDGIEFHPDEVEKTLVLTSNVQNNVLTFYYSSYKNATVTVNYVDMNGDPIADAHTEKLKVGKTFTLSRTPIAGWELNKAVEGTSYDGTAAGSDYKITEAVTENGLTFTLFYQKKATVTVVNQSQQYNGTPLTLPEALADQVTVDGLLDGDSLASVEYEYKNADSEDGTGRLNKGVATVTPKNAVIDGAPTSENGDYYKIRYISGTLEVTPIYVTVRIEPDRWTGNVYDGTVKKTGFTNGDKTLNDYIIISNNQYKEYVHNGDDIWSFIAALDNVTYDKDAAGLHYYVVAEKDAGTYNYNLDLQSGQLPNANGNYSVSLYVRPGLLQILPKEATVTTGTAEKEYDGTPLTSDVASITGLVQDDEGKVKVTTTGTVTNPDTVDNTYTIDWGSVKSSNYTITDNLGKLTVKPATLKITVNNTEKVYNGTEQSGFEFPEAVTGTGEIIEASDGSYKVEGLAEGDVLSVAYTPSKGTNVETYDNGSFGTISIVNSEGKDVTSYYTPSTTAGKLTITKKALTITAGSDTKVYDGTALEKDSYSNTELGTGDSIESVTVTGSQTVVGTGDNVASAAVIKNAKDETVTANYNITYVKGSLVVTAKPLTITADSATKVYDGKALTKNSYTNTDLATGDSIESVTVKGSQTKVGTSDNVPSAAKIVNAAGENVTASYEITYANGTLEVTKNAALIITADSDTKVYDGTALTKNTYQVAGLAEGDKVESVTVTGSQTVVGTGDNVPSAAKVVNAEGEDVTESYKITYTKGSLVVTAKPLTITADSDTKVYDGAALTKDSYTNTALAEGDKIESVTVTGSQTVVGSSDNVPSAAKVVNAAGEDVTESYAITYVNGTLEVTPKTLTITADSDTKVYDGAALTKDSYTNTALAEGDKIKSVTVTGSQTAVGSSNNVPSEAEIVNSKGEDVTASYEITYVNGTLEVTPKTLTITADSDTKVYDGTALTKNSYTNTDLATGDSITSVTVTGSQTTVGSSNNVPSAAAIVNKDGVDVTASYTITYANGTLEVTKKAVTITADSDSKVYDGTALTKNSYTNTDLAAGDSIESVTVTGSQTVVGRSENVPSAAKIVNDTGEDVTSSYEITYAKGKLEVTAKEVTITADSDTKVYDGTALTKDSYTNTALATGDNVASVTVTGSQTVVGSSDNVPSAAKIVNAAGDDVTASYKITYANGTLEVTKKAVTITADSDTKVYDGTPLTKDSYTNTALAVGDSIESVTVKGSQTKVGESPNVPSAAKIVNAAGEDVTASYEITYANGTLEVTKNAALIITADSDTKVYDGTPLTKNSYQVAGLADGDKVESVTVTGSQTVVGSSDNVPSAAKIVNAEGEDVTASYEITYAKGALEVTPKTLTITADSDDKVYDGTALTKNSYTNTALAAGDEIESVTVTGSQTVVGSSDNVPSAAKIVNAAGEDVTASYAITYINGKLEVTQKTITITADSDEKVYDGTALTKDSYTNTALATGDSIESVTVTGSQTVVGSSANVPSEAKIVNAAGEDVTASYAITYANGTLKVTKKAVTITADSDTKVYDGTALTKDSFTNTALAEGDKVDSVTVTGSQTIVGSSDNVPSAAKIVNAKGDDVTASYEITYANGTLEVTKKAVTITADSDTKVYDGTALTKDSYTNTALAEGDKVDSVTVTGSQTVVGSSDNVPSAAKIVNAAGADVTASYEITYANGKLEVTKKTVTITADSDTKVYDGTALTKDSYTNTALAEGDSIESVTVTGSQTTVGKSDNVPSEAKIVNAAGEDVTASYEITYANGTLEVTLNNSLIITADSDTKVYDGTALTKDSYKVAGLASGDKVDSVTVTGSQTVAGKSDNVPSAAKIVNAKGEDVTASYEITYANGTLEVTKKAVTITADSDTKVYDGTALTKDSYTNTTLAEGDKVDSVTVTGSQTVVGSSDNVPSAAKIVNARGDDVTSSYEITYANGSLEVTKKAVTITADSDTKVYDGTALTKDSYTNTALAEGDAINSVTVTGSQTVVGTSDNVPSAAKIVNAAGEDVTASYEITYANGSLEVTKKAVTITADSDTKVYDGTALTKSTFTNTALATGDSVDSVTVTGSQTVVGTSDNVPSAAKIVNAAGEDVTASYNITYANGTLEVTKKAVTITADGAKKTYDGTPLTKDSYTNTAIAEGDKIDSVTVTGSQTVVGTSNNVPSAAKIVNANDEDVTTSYDITYANGTLEVTKKSVTITADSDTKVYDGTPLTKNSYTNTDLAEGDEIESVTITGSQTVVGSSNNVPSAAKIVNANDEDVTTSYDITYANGTLEVTKSAALIITADSDTKVYDGTPLTKDSYQVAGLAAGDSVESVTVTGSQTIAGTSDNVPSAAKIVNAKGEDVTESYTITYRNGTLEVTKKAVTITADSDTKVYDGVALTKDSYTNTDLAEGDEIDSVTVTGSQTIVGSSNNVPSAAVIKNADGADVTASYEITYANGTLEVTKKTVTITADSDSKVYDGTALTKDSYTSTDLAEGDEIDSVTVTGSQTVAGKSDNVPSAAVIKNADGTDVTASYEITYANGTLEVTQKTVTITADSDTKVYDGTALTKSTFTNTALATGDSVDSVTVTGSQTVVGTSNNVPSAAKIVNAAGTDVTASYNITYANGTLEVTKKAVTITADGATKVYDGSALTKDSYTNTALAAGDTIDSVTVTGSQTVVGTSDNVPSAAVIKNTAGEDVTASYEITYANGTLEVTKKAVTITADSDTKVYDGTPLTKDSYTNTALAEGDEIDSVTVTGSQTAVGTSDNVPSAAKIVNKDGEDVTASYEITYANGTLEVTKNQALIITADSDTKTYDGTPLTKNSYKVAGLATGDSVESVTVTGSQTVVGTSDNVPSAAKVINAKGEDVTSSYDIRYANGTLEVTKKTITITADSDSKVYDGTALTKNSYTNTALAEGDAIESVTVTGSQTVVGTSDNVPSAAKIVNAAGTDVTASYDITYANGTLEVTKKSVTITADSDSKVYDGTALTKSTFTNTALAEGDEVDSVTVTGSQTVAGTSNNVPSAAKIVNAAGTDVTASYDITYANGTLEVTQKTVTITADSDTKVYDGTALTKNSYTNTALATGDKIDSVTVTGSQTVVGTSNNVPSAAKIVNAAGTDVTASYRITYANGTLEVTKKAVTITADSDTKVYDGSALTKNTFTNTALATGDSVDSVTVTGSQTVVGTSDNVPSAAVIKNAAGVDVTASYEITYANGTLEVTKKAVTITADSATKVYDGTPLTKNSYTNTALAAGDSIDSVTVRGSQTKVGSSDNVPSAAKIVNAAGDDVTASYEITYANGTLSVTLNQSLIITADSDTKTYDGTPLTKNSYQVTGLASGDTVESVTVTGSQTTVGTSNNVPSKAKVVNTAGEDVTASYDITYANGTLEVTKKAVTITADSDTKVYDGSALTKNTFTNTALAEGDEVESVKVTGSQTVVGTSDNVPSAAKIVNAAGTDVTASYEITYANGTLEVTKKAVTITADSDTKVYDGTALTKDSYKNTDLAAGDKIDSVKVAGSQTNVGSSDNVPSAAKIVNAKGDNVTDSYEITYANGTLEVTKKAVTITTGTASKPYDGTPLTNEEVTIDGLVEGESVTLKTTGTITEIGSTDNTYDIKWDKADADNYTVTDNLGTLTITKSTEEVTLTAATDSKTYDGTALTNAEVTASGLPEGFTYEATASGSQTDVGESANVVNDGYKFFDADGNDKTANFTNVKKVDGTLTVTPKAVTIKTGSDSKPYDGTALTKDEATITGLVDGESVTLKATGTITEVGSTDNTYSITWDKAKEANYTVTEELGTLTITENKAKVTLTAASDEKTYDGTPLTNAGVTAAGLPEGFTIEATASGSQTKAGSSDNVVNEGYKIFDADGNDKTANFTNVELVKGTLTVTKKGATVTANSNSKTYDGTPLTDDGSTTTGLAAGDIAKVVVEGSQTVVGVAENVITSIIIENAAGEDVTESYDIEKVNGELEVTQKTLTITAGSATKVYDGEALTKNSYSNTELAKGDKIESVKIEGSQTLVGSHDNVASEAKIVNAAGEDVTESYKITYKPGTLTVTDGTGDDEEPVDPEKVIKKTDKADGTTYHVGDTVTWNIWVKNIYDEEKTVKVTEIAGVTLGDYKTTLAAGEEINITATHVITAADVKAGTFTNSATAELGDITKTGEDTVNTGTLAIEITANSASKVYDGEALTDSGYKQTSGELAKGDKIDSVKVEGTQTLVGSSDNVASEAKIVNAAGDDVTAGYEIKYVKGTLTVTDGTNPGEDPVDPEKVVKKTDKADGTTYQVGDTVTWNIWVKNIYDEEKTVEVTEKEGVTLSEYPKTLEAGEEINITATYVITGADAAAGNYVNEVTAKLGDLEKTGTDEVDTDQIKIQITANSDSKVYDGQPLTNDGYKLTDGKLVDGNKIDSVKVEGSQTEVGKSDNTASAAKIIDAEGTDVTEGYKIEYVKGSLEVTAAELTEDPEDPDDPQSKPRFVVTGPEDTKYNGEEQKQPVTVKDTKTGKDLVEGTDCTIEYSEDVTNAGTVTVTITGKGNYSGDIVKTYEITKRDVNLKSESATKTYDGTALEKPEVTVSGDGFVDKDVKVSPEATGSIIDAGSVVNTIAYEIFEEVAKNYNVTKDEGTLTVEKATIIDPENPADPEDPDAKRYEVSQPEDVVYNGKDQKQPITVTDTKTGKDLVEGKDMTVSYSDDTKNVGTVTITVKGEGNYDGTVTRTYKITPKDLTITADSDSKVYDGTALTKDSYTATDLAEGDKFDSVTVTGSQTDAGKSDNVPSDAKIVDGAGADMTANYSIEYVNGTLEVTAAEITDEPEDPEDPSSKRFEVSQPEDTKYNGEEQKQTVTVHDNKTDKDLVEGKDFELTYSDNTIDVGGVTVTVKGIGNYTGTVDRHYTITPRELILTSASAEKVYDGTPLVRNEQSDVTIGGDGLAKRDADKLTFNITGSQTYVGSSDNTFTYDWAEEETEQTTGVLQSITDRLAVYAAAENANYTVEVVYGTLTVTDKGVNPDDVVTKIHADKTYKVGDVVGFKVSATNIYDEVKTITLEEKKGVELEQSVFENVEPGQTVTTTAYYTITEKDAKNGEFENVVKASFSGEDTVFENNDIVDDIEAPAADDTSNGPKTGDDNNIAGWLGLMALAAAGGTGLVVKRRREDDDE